MTRPDSPLRSFALALACLAMAASAGCEARTPADAPPAAGAPAQATTAATSPTGTYALPAPLVSELRVVALPGRPGEYRVEVHGGGDPRDGAGVAADCQAVAEGRLDGGRLDAALLPFESDAGGLDAIDLESSPRLAITFDGDTARLEGGFAHCPMRTAMTGAYRRTSSPRLFVDCAPLPAACWNRD